MLAFYHYWDSYRVEVVNFNKNHTKKKSEIQNVLLLYTKFKINLKYTCMKQSNSVIWAIYFLNLQYFKSKFDAFNASIINDNILTLRNTFWRRFTVFGVIDDVLVQRPAGDWHTDADEHRGRHEQRHLYRLHCRYNGRAEVVDRWVTVTRDLESPARIKILLEFCNENLYTDYNTESRVGMTRILHLQI